MLKYAGIGARDTPAPFLEQMAMIGYLFAGRFVLRSGCARRGADVAFETGARRAKGAMELFDIESARRGKTHWFDHAAQFHPTWHSLTSNVRHLHARNSAVMLGDALDDPVNFVVCWTEYGQIKGGTGQALRIANAMQIPVFNLANDGALDALWSYTNGR